METQPGFNLSAALGGWRRAMSLQRSLMPEARRELETHLLDLFTELRAQGMGEEEAFRLARKRMGEPQLLNHEFKIAMKNTLLHPDRPAAMAAWAVFVISFFLPAFGEMAGWQCACLYRFFWPQALQGQWLSIHYLLLTLANLVMLGSPFLLAWARQDARGLKWVRGLSAGAMILVWLFVVELAAHGDGHNFKIGCYLWSASFALLFAATLLQTAGRKVSVRQNA